MNLPIEELKKSLKEKLVDGIGKVFESLVDIIPASSSKFNTLIHLKSQHKKYKQDWLQQIISQDDASLQLNQLNRSVLDFIDELEEDDLQEKVTGEAKDDRVGKVCFRIPPTMQIDERNDCSVWISFDEDTLLKEIKIEVDDQLQNIRVSDTMGVELIDDTDGEAFNIKTYDETVQPIESNLNTQWNFRVTPLKVGTFPLILKIVAVVEQRGKELKKSIVLEEEVNIVATSTAEVIEAKQLTGKAMMNGFMILPFLFPKGDGNSGAADVPVAGGDLAETVSSTGSTFSLAKILGAIILLGGAFFLFQQMNTDSKSEGTTTFNCLDKEAWNDIKSSRDTSLVLEYLKNCPDGKHVVQANNLLDSWRNDLVIETPTPMELDTTILNPVDTTYTKEMVAELTNPPVEQLLPKDSISKSSVAEIKSVSPPINETPIEIKVEEPVNFKVAAFKPVHPECLEKNQKEWQECTEEKIRDLVKKYVKKASRNLEGTTRVSFLISKDGSIITNNEDENENEKLTNEVIKALQKLPQFKPGQNSKGQPVQIRYMVPVRIK